MKFWLRKKSKVEKLKERYTLLMKKSFELALRDIKKSKRIHNQADRLFEEIKQLIPQQVDK